MMISFDIHTIDAATVTRLAVTPCWNRPFAAGRRLGDINALAGRRAR